MRCERIPAGLRRIGETRTLPSFRISTNSLSHLYQLEGVARKWNEHEQGELPEDSLESLVEPFALICIYGTTAANEAAEKLREWLVVDVFGPRPENHEYERANLEENFLHAVRNDFAIPDVLSLNS